MKKRYWHFGMGLAGLIFTTVASHGQVSKQATPAAPVKATVYGTSPAPPAATGTPMTQSAPTTPTKNSPGQACDLNKTLALMDTASAKFQSAQAEFSWTQYEAVVQQNEAPQTGTSYFARHGGATSMALDIRQPAAKYVTFDGSEVDFYTPDTNQETLMSAVSNKDQVDTFLTLGFGGSGKDLQKNWDVTCAGTETIAGVLTTKLELVAKQQSVRNTFSKVTIWVDPTRAISLKQIFNEPSGDSRTDLFTNIKYNAQISPSVFKVKTKPGVQVTRK